MPEISAAEILSQNRPTNAPEPDPATAAGKEVSVHDVYEGLPTPKEPKSWWAGVKDAWSNYGKNAHFDRENKRLAGEQFTQPDVGLYKDGLGEAQFDETNAALYKDKSGNWVPTDKNKHVVLIDPADNKYKVYNRSANTDLGGFTGRAVGLGRLAEDALATTGLSTGPTTKLAREGVNIAGMGKGVAPEAGAVTHGGSALTADGAKAGQTMTPAANMAEDVGHIKDVTGVDVHVPRAIASENPTVTMGTKVMSRIPLAGMPIQHGVDQMGDDISKAIGKVAELPAGRAVTAAEAGRSAAEGIQGTTTPVGGKLSQRIEAAYDDVESRLLRPGYRHQLGNVRAVADEIAKAHGSAGYQFPESVKEILGPLLKSEASGLTYKDLRLVRTKLGQVIGQPEKLPVNTDMAELKRLYGAVSDDLKDLVKVAGGKGGKNYKGADEALFRADRFTEMASRRREELVKLLGTKGTSDEGVFHRIRDLAGSGRRADGDLLLKAKRAMGKDDWGEMAGAVAGQLGKRVGPRGEYIDPVAFATDYHKMSDAGKLHLFGSNTVQRSAMDTLAKMAAKYKEAEGVVGSGHGPMTHGAAGLGVGGAALLFGAHEYQHARETGDWGGPLRAGLALIAAAGVAKGLANPVTARSAMNWARRYENLRLRPGSTTLAAYNNAAQSLENAVRQGKTH